MEIRDLSLSLHTAGEFLASPAKITLNSPAYTGGESLTFLDPDEMDVEPAVLKPQSGPAVPVADEIILPENPDRYLRWVELPVSEEEQAQVSSGRVMLVSPMEDNTLAIYTVQNMTWNENHVPGAWLPGLVPVCAGEEDCFLPVRYLRADMQGLEAETVSVPWISNSDIWNYKTLRIKELLFQADYASGNALVTNISFEGDSFDRQEEMEIISCLYPIVEKGEEKEGRLLPFSEMTFVNGIAIGWEAYMEEQPFRIQLRPVRKEDQIQILFSVTLQDGTGYSILTPDPAGEDPGT